MNLAVQQIDQQICQAALDRRVIRRMARVLSAAGRAPERFAGAISHRALLHCHRMTSLILALQAINGAPLLLGRATATLRALARRCGFRLLRG